MTANNLCAVSFLLLLPMVLPAQSGGEHYDGPLKHWAAQLYWQPSPAEAEASAFRSATPLPRAEGPVNSLVFVGLTPCRVADTRSSQPFTGAFGPPSLVGG